MSVLTVIVAFDENLSVGQIGSVLDIDSTLVDDVVKFGPAKSIFNVGEDKVIFSVESFGTFLQDGDRSGGFFIFQGRIDALFIQILSRGTACAPPHSHSRELLMDVLTVAEFRSFLENFSSPEEG